MSLPFTFLPQSSQIDYDLSKNVACHEVFLDADERYDIYSVKAAERPHLLHCDEYASIENDGEEIGSNDEKKSQVEILPLIDGCDIPGWRKEGLVTMSLRTTQREALQGVLNVGAACSLFRRDRQWPILYPLSQKGVKRMLWKELLSKFKDIPPDPNNEAITVDNETFSQLIPIPNTTQPMVTIDSEGVGVEPNLTRMATKFALEIEQTNIPAKIIGGTSQWSCMPRYENDDNTERKGGCDFTGGGKGGWT